MVPQGGKKKTRNLLYKWGGKGGGGTENRKLEGGEGRRKKGKDACRLSTVMKSGRRTSSPEGKGKKRGEKVGGGGVPQ